MNRNIPTEVDWFFLVVYVVFGAMFLYEAWENLVNHRISKIGPDAISIWLGLKLGKQRTRERILRTIRNPKRLRYVGVYALLLGLGGIYLVVYWLSLFMFGG